MNFIKDILKIPRLKLILLLPAGILLVNAAARFPSIVEKIYSRNIDRGLVQVLSIITGVLPFSLAEFIIGALILTGCWWIIKTVITVIKGNGGRGKTLLSFFVNLAAAVSIVYFMFVLVWGFNYQRLPFSAIANYDTRPSAIAELKEACQEFINRSNSLRDKVAEDKAGVMKVEGGKRYALDNAWKGYDRIGTEFPFLKGNYGRPKGVVFSPVMSVIGISGVYFPFTGEANVNIDVTDSEVPFTTCHEMAHQRGFSREDEANYIAYLACKNHPDSAFQYSGNLMALTYSMNALYSHDRDAYKQLRAKYSAGVLRDLKAINTYWAKYESPVSDISDKVNNAYLKANMQSDGVYSYGRMVDLLIAERRKGR